MVVKFFEFHLAPNDLLELLFLLDAPDVFLEPALLFLSFLLLSQQNSRFALHLLQVFRCRLRFLFQLSANLSNRTYCRRFFNPSSRSSMSANG